MGSLLLSAPLPFLIVKLTQIGPLYVFVASQIEGSARGQTETDML